MESLLTMINRSILLFAALLILTLISFNEAWSQATCSTPTKISNFGVDGDVYANSPGSILGDSWFYSNVFPGPGIGVIGTTAATATPAISAAAFGSIIQSAGTLQGRNRTYLQRMSVPPLTQVNGITLIDAFAVRDNISPDSTSFLGSNKNGDNPALWSIGISSVPTKNDIIDAGGHLRRQVATGSTLNDLWLYAYVSRLGISGSAYTDVEIYRNVPILNTATGQLTNTGPASTGGHTAFTFNSSAQITSPGDMIIGINYDASGGIASTRIWCDIDNLDGNGNGYVWFNAQPNRPFNLTGNFISGSGSNGYEYAEIQSLSGASCLIYSVLNPANTPAGAWGNLTGAGANYDTNIQPEQLVNIALNFTQMGLDFASLNGPCFNIFGALWFKSRSSASYSSELKDAVGPYQIGNFSEIQANGGPDRTLNCTILQTTLNGSSLTPGAIASWTTPNGNIVSGANTFSPVVNAPGIYILSAANAALSSCIATDTVIVVRNSAVPNVNAGFDKQITCSTPTVTLDGSSTTGGVSYSWMATSGGNILSGANTATPIVSSAGCYILTVTNPANGCIDKDTACVTSNVSVPVISGVTQINVGCFAACTGSINFSVAGGQSPYNYNWSNGSTSASLSNLCSGNYTVTVTGLNGCTTSSTYTITQPSATLSASLTVTQNVSCNGGANGSITASAIGGTAPYTYLWSSGTTSATALGLTAGTYTVTITDQNGCTFSQSRTITQPAAAVNVTATIGQQVNCFGGSNGSINLSVSGGTSPYTYLWSNAAITQDVAGLVAGTYTVTVTDANGCTTQESRTITQPAAVLSAVLTSSQLINCFGGNNGSINITVSGGTAPYSYAWNSGATTQDLTGLAAGSYSVTITDSRGCTFSDSYTISGPAAALSSSASVTQQVSCFAGVNGAIDVTVSGGTAPYSYSWNNGASTQDLSGLSAGTYSITITDANNCTSIASASINQPAAALNASANVSSTVSCFGGDDGQISLSVNGGTSPYSYLWSNGATTQSIIGLTSGIYTVTVTDDNGCTKIANATVTEPAATLSGSTTITGNISCFSGNNGSIDLTVAGGTGPFSYSWSNGATSQDLGGLAAGTYNVTITDARGCTANSSGTISQPAGALSTNVNISQNIPCFGSGNGAINLTVSGGTTPYNFVWSNGASTQGISGLAAGIYVVTITDANGCNATSSITITQPSAALNTSISGNQPVLCFGGNNGSLNLNTTGGTFPYTYAWSNGETSSSILNLSAGTYTVTVTDANGCTDQTSGTVIQPSAQLTSSANASQQVSCFGGNNGSVNLSVNGGTSPYTYSWSNGASIQNITGLVAGTYTVTITDGNGCQSNSSAIITQPTAALTAISTADQMVSCFGGSNGAISVAVSGGTSPYTYLWNNGATTQNISGLTNGTYTITVTDANGCVDGTTSVISQPASAISATSAVTQVVSCIGGSDGSINVTVSGGTSPYSYLWSNGATTEDLSNAMAGTYTVTITDANGCTTTQTKTITQPAAALAAIANPSANVLCFGGNNGSISVVVSGGTPGYNYLWNTFATSQNISGLLAGTYTVTVTDSRGCTTISNATINQPSASLAATATVSGNVSCFGGNNGAINVSVSGGTTPYSYLWSNGTTTQNINGLVSGSYTVTVTDANGCTAIQTLSVSQPASALNASATIGQTVLCFGGNIGAVNLNVNGGTSPYSYAWSNGATSQNINTLIAGTYTVTVTDANGCTDVTSATVTQPAAALSAVPTVSSNVSCFAGNNGAISLVVSGGNAPYTFAWSNGSSNQNLTGLTAGTFNVLVTDANGCSANVSATISQPAAGLSSALNVSQNISCFGGSNGSIDLTVNDGTSPYTYVWSNGATTQDISGVVSGTYTVTITDANGCTDSESATITQPTAALNASASISQQVNCFGGNNGSISLVVSGGTNPYSFTWSNGASTQNVSGLSVGTYLVTVTDANGCTLVESATISQPAAALNASANVNADVNCFGGNNGQISLAVTGGTAPYSFIWSNGAATQNITNLLSGTYTVTVTDANGCISVATGTVTQPVAALSASTTVTGNISCFFGNNGSVDLTVSGGTAPYSFVWSNGAVTEDLSGLAAGTYNVTITDSNSCTTTSSATIIQPAGALSAIINISQNIPCFGGGSGAIDLTVSGGTLPYNFIWSNGAASEDISGLASGVYTVTITDANGCNASATGTITQPTAALSSSISANNPVLCFGGNTGSLQINAAGGTFPYTYVWSNGQTSASILNLNSGPYTVTVTDANGCTTIQSAIVTQPAGALNTTINATQQVFCNGGADGIIDITVTGGTASYSFNWSNGSTSEDLSALPAGTYTVTITDANGCQDQATATITEPLYALSSSISSTQQVNCFAGNNGSIDLTVNGGTAPYSYVWSNGATTQDISGLVTGTYSVSITDANGCTDAQTVVISQPSAALAVSSTNIQPVLCFAGNTGSIDITVTGGTSPYSFVWSNGATTEDIIGLATGSYTVTVTDANGCTQQNSAVISQPVAALAGSVAGTNNVGCFGGSTGTADITVTGGTQPYSYVWSNGSVSEDLAGLTAGTYTVTVSDANGCTESLSVTITEPAAALVSALVVTQQVACFGDETGAIDLTVTGGTAPYIYSWSNGSTTEDISLLFAGTYSVTVTDANGCTSDGQATITQPTAPLLALVAVTSNVYCTGGSTGSLDLTTNGGTAPYSFLWSNGSTNEDISNLATGVYTVTVTDANGCSSVASGGIGQPGQQLTATVSVIQNVLCFNGNNGFIDVTISGGTAPFVYSWSNGATTEDIAGLIVGIYTLTVIDANGCDTSLTAAVIQPQAPLIPVLVVNQNVSCYGGSDGQIGLTVSGGTPPYVYLWSNGSTSTNLNNVPAGAYTVTITDGNGCNAIITDNVTQPASPLTAPITVGQPVACYGATNGTITANATGGTPAYTYLWNTGATTATLNGLTAGTYSVTVTDSKGCTYSETITLNQPSAPLALSGITTVANCLDSIGGSVTISVTGGTLPYTYQWSNGSTAQNIPVAMPGTYTVTVTDANGCTETGAYVVGNNSEFHITPGGPTTICVGETVTLIADSIAGGTYQWYYGGNILNGATGNVFITPAAGFYSVSITVPCGTFFTDSIEVIVKSIENASISNNQIICPPESVQLFASGGVTYEWTPATNISFTNVPDPIVNPIVTTTYTVTITNEFGCKTDISVEVGVVCDSLMVPNGFSPNDDGTNDGYVIDGIENYPGNKLWVYNRWGNLVYKAKDYRNDWDGVCNVSGIYMGKKVPTGTYYFILDLNDNSKPRAGYLIIRR